MSRKLRTLLLLISSAAWLLASNAARAQTCEEDDAGDEDAGDEDGGFVCEPADSGTRPPDAEPDAALSDASVDVDAGDAIHEACSCETVENSSAGDIHVCTGAREHDVCASFECESSIVRSRPCPTRGVALCCEMPARGLYSQLYEDCDHPNCETGFRSQCYDFGGSISAGPCVVEEEDADDDSGGGCTVRIAGPHRGSAAAVLWLVGILLSLRGRRRR